ncbi:unnamed protein product [Ambrosiozyma monospora]|uniref:Unnamed protein product n=1 Tax=Ambrosiozyma monospora TaxID=43982 RepID=A0ACB5T8T0_AMBMO|nr:unnamed protein product [Ambrosiozyma monospora]
MLKETWLDAKPARRLDGVLCLAAECMPLGKARETSVDGVERQMAINYLAHYHLLTLLQPALKVQPPGRDVRVLLSTCLSQSMGSIDLSDLLWDERRYPVRSPWTVYGTSKMMLNMFGKEFQRRLDKVGRKDGAPNTLRVNIVNPGIVRTPSTRRAISMGTIWGLLLYLVLYPIFWLFFKSAEQGMQSFIYAVCNPDLIDLQGGKYIKECTVMQSESRAELNDEELQGKIFELTKMLIQKLEKESAIERNKGKSRKEREKLKKEKAKESEKKDNNQHSVFETAFKNSSADLFPDMSKLRKTSGNADKAKEQLLKDLDAKFDASHKKKTTSTANTTSATSTTPSTTATTTSSSPKVTTPKPKTKSKSRKV